MELGLAVAASACVPGIFPPLAITDLYPDGIRVQLVDGGIHDALGVQGLLDLGCTCFVVSDASRQMEVEREPDTQGVPVLRRSKSILADRVREEECSRFLDGKDRPVAFMHLRKGLSAKAVSWVARSGLPAEGPKEERVPPLRCQGFGVDSEVQNLLSYIRTDFDAFTDVEAHALMMDAYLMSEAELRSAPRVWDLIPKDLSTPVRDWRFLEIGPWLGGRTTLLKHLEVGKHSLFKVFRLSWRVTGATLLVAGAIGTALLFHFWDLLVSLLATPLTVGQVLAAAVLLTLGFVPRLSRQFKAIRFLRSPSEAVTRFVVRALLPALCFPLVWIHLWLYNPVLLALGKMKRLGSVPARDQVSPVGPSVAHSIDYAERRGRTGR